jgi:D-alanyl-D-alanine carboxypeptidase (penicillin-binding protein 5/6)
MGHPLFAEISGAYRHDATAADMSESRRLINSNELLMANSKYYYRPCTSGKTSATFEGGYSFVSYAEADGLTLICVVLGSDTVMFDDESAEMRNLTETRRLYEWGFSEFSWRDVLSPADFVGKVPVAHGNGADFVNLHPGSSITLLLDNDISSEDFAQTVKHYPPENGDTLYAPVNAGDTLGELTLEYIGDTAGKVALKHYGVDFGPILLVASTSVELNRLQFIRMQISDMLASKTARIVMWVLSMLVLGYIALVIRYNILRRKRLQKIAEAKRKLIQERKDPNKR